MTAVDDGDDDGAPGRQEGVTPDTIGAVLENIRRDLGDRSTEKRRTAIALIDKQIRAWIANPALRARVVFALDAFIADLASGKLDLQKSGLVGVSVCVVADGQNPAVRERLPEIIPLVISMLSVQGAVLRLTYLACECLYNIIKVARQAALHYLVPLFSRLLALSSCCEALVRNAAELLTELLKDIVLDSRDDSGLILSALRPVLAHGLRIHRDAHIRMFLLAWIDVLHNGAIMTAEDAGFAVGPLFAMLSDAHPDICVHARRCLRALSRPANLPFIARFAMACRHPVSSRVAALESIKELVRQLDSTVPHRVLHSILSCLDDENESIADAATEADAAVRSTIIDLTDKAVLAVLVGAMSWRRPRSRSSALHYLLLGVRRHPSTDLPNLLPVIDDVPVGLLPTVVEIIARIAVCRQRVAQTCGELVDKIVSRPSMMERRAASVAIARFAEHFGGPFVLSTIAAHIVGHSGGRRECARLVHTLQMCLMLTPELAPCHTQLPELFPVLFEAWCCNPIAAIALCLQAGVYELASLIVGTMDRLDASSWDSLEQVVQLVELLDSPALHRARMDLASAMAHPYLYKCLLGLLLLLPQCPAFDALHRRLVFVSRASLGQCSDATPAAMAWSSRRGLHIDIDRLFNVFLAKNDLRAA